MTEKYGALMSHVLDDFFCVGPADSEKCSADLSILNKTSKPTLDIFSNI